MSEDRNEYDCVRETVTRLYRCVDDELRRVDTVGELTGSDEHYAVKITITQEDGCPPTAVYGVYNRQTGVREIETRQLQAAFKWVDALSKMTYGPSGVEMPGLEDGDDIPPGQMH